MPSFDARGEARVIFEFIEGTVELTLVVAGLYFALGAYVHHKQPAWSTSLEKRRTAILWMLILGVSAIKVTEDVLGGESGPIDEAILRFIRGLVSSALDGFFDAVTFTGSSRLTTQLARIPFKQHAS